MEVDQQQRINAAAEQFADAVQASYQAVAKHGEEAQELNAELTQQFFNRVNEHLRTHAERNRQLTQELGDQHQRRREAGQQIAQESVGAYMDFMNSMFSFSQGAAAQGRRPDSDTAPTGPDAGGEGRGGRGRSDSSVSPRTEPSSTTPGREPGGGEPGGKEDGEEDKGLLKKAKDALTGEDKPRSEEPREPSRDDPPSGRP